MADKVATFVHWLLAYLLKGHTGEITVFVNKGNLEKATLQWQTPGVNSELQELTEIDLDDPFLSKYMPRPGNFSEGSRIVQVKKVYKPEEKGVEQTDDAD